MSGYYTSKKRKIGEQVSNAEHILSLLCDDEYDVVFLDSEEERIYGTTSRKVVREESPDPCVSEGEDDDYNLDLSPFNFIEEPPEPAKFMLVRDYERCAITVESKEVQTDPIEELPIPIIDDLFLFRENVATIFLSCYQDKTYSKKLRNKLVKPVGKGYYRLDKDVCERIENNNLDDPDILENQVREDYPHLIFSHRSDEGISQEEGEYYLKLPKANEFTRSCWARIAQLLLDKCQLMRSLRRE